MIFVQSQRFVPSIDTKGIGESFPEKLTVSFWLLFKMEKENHKLWIQPFPSDIEPNPELVTCVILDFLQFAFHVYLQRVLIRALYLIVFSDWSLWIVTILKLIFKLFDCVNVFFCLFTKPVLVPFPYIVSRVSLSGVKSKLVSRPLIICFEIKQSSRIKSFAGKVQSFHVTFVAIII